MSKKFIFPLRIYYEDTDAAGVVYYANYLKYMERARTEWCSANGYELRELAEEYGFLMVVRNVNVEYLKPARLGDRLEVVSEAKNAGKTSMVFQHVIRSSENHNLVFCKGSVTLVAVNSNNMRPCKIISKLSEGITHGN